MHKKTPPSSSLEEIEAALKPLTGSPESTAVFLDLDGTLAPIVSQPDAVAVPPAIVRLVRSLARRFLAVTVVSGRPATEAKRIVGISELAYIGNHGLETMLPGHTVVVSEDARPYMRGIRQLAEFCRSMEETAEAGISVEDKMVTVSLHYRRAADQEAARRFIAEKILPKISEWGLTANEGRMVIEIKPPVKVNKGVSVGGVIDRLEARQAIYMGDDTTDIDALKELRRRRGEGDAYMVGVGVVSDEMPEGLPEFADLLVDRSSGVETVLTILAGEEL